MAYTDKTEGEEGGKEREGGGGRERGREEEIDRQRERVMCCRLCLYRNVVGIVSASGKVSQNASYLSPSV